MGEQHPHGVVAQGEEFGVGGVVGLNRLGRHVSVESTLDEPRLVGVDHKAVPVGNQRGLDGGPFALELRLGMGQERLLPHPSLDDALGKLRAVFEAQVVRDPMGQAVFRQRMAKRRRHRHRPRFGRTYLRRTAREQQGHQPACVAPQVHHSRTKLYSAWRLILNGYFWRNSSIHACSR